MVNEQILSSSDSKKENLVNKPILDEPAFKNCEKAGPFFSQARKKNLVSKLILPSSDLSREGRDLNALYKKEAIRDKKNIAKFKYILAK